MMNSIASIFKLHTAHKILGLHKSQTTERALRTLGGTAFHKYAVNRLRHMGRAIGSAHSRLEPLARADPFLADPFFADPFFAVPFFTYEDSVKKLHYARRRLR
jgi:hypothetical protein